MKVTIVLNGKAFHCAKNSSVSDLLESLDLHPKGVAVEHNKSIVRKEDYDRTILNEGDKLEIVHFVGGG